jgi:hypothetical protein
MRVDLSLQATLLTRLSFSLVLRVPRTVITAQCQRCVGGKYAMQGLVTH